jgi:hypothetical protein
MSLAQTAGVFFSIYALITEAQITRCAMIYGQMPLAQTGVFSSDNRGSNYKMRHDL